MEKLSLGDSKIQSYVGIEKRDGFVTIAKRLLQSKLLTPLLRKFSHAAYRHQA